jgi:RNA 3'-terminal phosphate cyclase (ATP)
VASNDLVELDGSEGEGGGQILRSALALSILTGKGFDMVRVRAGRPKPGLRPQHLEAVRAAVAVCSAQVEGDRVASQKLRFVPATPVAGNYSFAIATAGSTALVLHTIYLPLALQPAESRITIAGGTHVPFAPCVDYLAQAWLPAVERLGLNLAIDLERCGFYPAGGGRLNVIVRPPSPLRPVDWLERGPISEITPLSFVGRLPRSIAERQARRAIVRLNQAGLADLVAEPTIESRESAGPGTMLGLKVAFAGGQTFFYALGARGKPAETVADEAVDDLVRYLDSDDAPVDPHLADQLLLPLAATARVSRFKTSTVTNHLLTNARVIEQFLPVSIDVAGRLGRPAVVTVRR